MSFSEIPLVSIVIPCFNREAFVCKAITSALEHNYPNKEVIVIDDGSTDGSLNVIRSFGATVHWETGPNRGACAARNRGLVLAKGSYVQFLDADDYLEGHLISGLVTAALKECADIVFGPYAFAFPDGKRVSGHLIPRCEDFETLVSWWLTDRFVPPCSVLWRAEYLRSIGGWNSAIVRNQDGELIYRALLSGARFSFSSAGRGIYVQHTSATRVSTNFKITSFLSQLSIYEYIKVECQKRLWTKALTALAKAYYNLAVLAYIHGHDMVAQEALFRAAELGLRRHYGTLAHRIAASILGLRLKVKLSSKLQRIRTAV